MALNLTGFWTSSPAPRSPPHRRGDGPCHQAAVYGASPARTDYGTPGMGAGLYGPLPGAEDRVAGQITDRQPAAIITTKNSIDKGVITMAD